VSTWRDTFGVDPTTDPATIAGWADDGWDLAVRLNDLPLDGPVHPGTLHIGRGWVAFCCPVMGSAMAEAATVAESKAAQVAALEWMRDWGCTFAMLDVRP
jgi:hypothetical protein